MSKDSLLKQARAKINRLTRLAPGWDGEEALPPAVLPATVINSLLDKLLFDDCATPQVTPTPDGGLEVEWLVAREAVHLECDPLGSVFLSVEDPRGNPIHDGEFPFFAIDHILMDQARAALEKVSHKVLHRAAAG